MNTFTSFFLSATLLLLASFSAAIRPEPNPTHPKASPPTQETKMVGLPDSSSQDPGLGKRGEMG